MRHKGSQYSQVIGDIEPLLSNQDAEQDVDAEPDLVDGYLKSITINLSRNQYSEDLDDLAQVAARSLDKQPDASFGPDLEIIRSWVASIVIGEDAKDGDEQ